MTVKQSAKYVMAVAIGFVLGSATSTLFPSHDRADTTLTAPSDQFVLLKWRKASAAAEIVRESLRNDGLDVAIGSDDSLNAVLIVANKQTTELAKNRVRDLDNIIPVKNN
jgi:hypothetical protein